MIAPRRTSPPPPASSAMPDPAAHRTVRSTLAVKGGFLLVSLAVLALDQWTKWLVELHLPQHTAQPVVSGLFNLTHVRNSGVAFGLFAGGGDVASVLLAVLGLGALTAVGVYFWLAPPGHRVLMSSLALIIGGAVGNLVDRVVSGAVTDFLDVYVGTHHWPSFNVADSAISIGIALMAVDAFRTPHREREAAPEIPAATSP